MSEPLAYLLTWTCYGTWLHGDMKGSVDDEHNLFDTKFVEPDAQKLGRAGHLLRHAPVGLDARARSVVTNTIVAHCRHRDWHLHAIHIRTNHLHLVVTAPGVLPEKVLSQFKAWTTRRLREAGCVGTDANVWTHHGSTRYLWKEQSVHAAIGYVLEEQGKNLK